jgi:hypothetical protein
MKGGFMKKLLFLSLMAASSSAYCETVTAPNDLIFTIDKSACRTISTDDYQYSISNTLVITPVNDNPAHWYIENRRRNFDQNPALITCHTMFPPSGGISILQAIATDYSKTCDTHLNIKYAYTLPDGSGFDFPTIISYDNPADYCNGGTSCSSYAGKRQLVKKDEDIYPVRISFECAGTNFDQAFVDLNVATP